MSKYIDNKITKKLNRCLFRSVVKKQNTSRSSSIAYSQTKKEYCGALVESDTNTFTIPPEHVALMLSTAANDYKVDNLITMIEEKNAQNFVSPIVCKIIKDHSIRTGLRIRYTIVDSSGKILFTTKDIGSTIPNYNPPLITLQSRLSQKPSAYSKKTPLNNKTTVKDTLKDFALKGLLKNFPLYDSASGYATAVLTKNKKIFFAGQYSSPDKRLGLHSEVNAVLAALMSGEKDITHIGLVSTKYLDEPCNMCGNCRQFLSEMAEKFNFNPVLFLYSKDTETYTTSSLDTYLPSSWKSKNWNT